METRYSDVWVIGSGGAGLTAAIAARQAGASVTVLGKAAPGKGTCTTMAVGIFAGPWDGVSEETYKKRTQNLGYGLNDTDMLDVQAAEAPARFHDLMDWGMHSRSAPGSFMAMPKEDPGPKAPLWGREIVATLAAKAAELGVEFVNSVVVRSIESNDEGVRLGAFAPREDTWLDLRGGAVILAAGGAGGLYQHHDNPQRITGDAYALALDAGVILRDMEFVQFYPMAILENGRGPVLIEPESAGMGRIVNARGEDLFEKHGIPAGMAASTARDTLSLAMFREMELEGLDVHLDLRHISKEEWCANPVMESKWAYLNKRFDAFNRPLTMSPVAHFTMGGVRTDTQGATSVPGFYAAGEAVGGLHGANRMGGNALTETLVFGHRAGLSAAAWAKGRDQGRALVAEQNFAPAPAQGKPESSADTLLQELRRVMWRQGGILRDAEGLNEGLGSVAKIAEQASCTLGIIDPTEFRKHLELQLATTTATLILEGALRREESRGAHFRSDFPKQDDEKWMGHLEVKKIGKKKVWGKG